MIVYRCDLCSQAKECLQKKIDGKEYDICSQCWSALAEKLSGKGRVNKSREIVLLPPLRVNEREDDEPKPTPGEPPKIWGVATRPAFKRSPLYVVDLGRQAVVCLILAILGGFRVHQSS